MDAEPAAPLRAALPLLALDAGLAAAFDRLWHPHDPVVAVLGHLAWYAVRFGAVLGGLALLTRRPLAPQLAFDRARLAADLAWGLRCVTLGACAFTALAAGAVLGAAAGLWHLPAPDPETTGYLAYLWGGEHAAFLVLMLLLSVVAAPLVEETAWRGLLLPALLARLAPAPAVLLSAALFAWLHVGPYGQGGWGLTQGFGALLIGAVFWWRRSLVVAMLGHAAGNLWLELAGPLWVALWQARPAWFS